MIKNIFIHIGNDTGTHSIKQFWKTHIQYLDKNGFWHPDYEEVLTPPPQMSWLQYHHDAWLLEIFQQTYNWPSTGEILTRIEKTLLSKPHIHSLLFSFHDLQICQSAEYFATISFLRQIFSESNLHVLWQQTPLDIAIEMDIHSRLMVGFNLSITYPTAQQALASDDYLQYDDIRSQFTTAWGKAVSINVTQCNTGDVLLQWQQWLNLPQPYPQINPINTILSPKVFAYIKVAQPSIAWEKFGTNEFSQCKQPYNWL